MVYGTASVTEVTTCWCILTHEGHTTKEGPDKSGPSCAGKNLLLFLRSLRHEVDRCYSYQSDDGQDQADQAKRSASTVGTGRTGLARGSVRSGGSGGTGSAVLA